MKHLQELRDQEVLHKWIVGNQEPHSTVHAHARVEIDATKVLHAYRSAAVIRGQEFIVIPSNMMRIIMGYDMVRKVDNITEADESPMQDGTAHTDAEDLRQGVHAMQEMVEANEELKAITKSTVAELIKRKYDRNWKAKYDLQEPAELPPMKIVLREGAKSAKIKRHYNWTQEQ